MPQSLLASTPVATSCVRTRSSWRRELSPAPRRCSITSSTGRSASLARALCQPISTAGSSAFLRTTTRRSPSCGGSPASTGAGGRRPALLHDDAALLLEVLAGEGEVRHAVALQVEHHRERLLREVVQVSGVVARRVAVGGAAVALDQVVELAGAELLPPVEHHVLEEV